MAEVTYTTQDLVNVLLGKTNNVTEEPEVINYCLYVRKSTIDEKRQPKSLEDQISACMQLSSALGLNVVKVIQEDQSAKDYNKRPLFREMLDDIARNKYQGILAWHPDRLSRNMREAGEIIDLLDKRIIKDLKFASFSFENTPSGKMLLGMTFVMSKEYSDKLSQDVKRGVENRTYEGKLLNVTKHGYYRDNQHLPHADGKNFEYIKQAFKYRVEGHTLDAIVDYLDKTDYTDARGISGSKRISFKFDENSLSRMFSDPFYAGALRNGGRVVDLTEQVLGFIPAVSVDNYMLINKDDFKVGKAIRRLFKEKRKVKADLLRGIVICGYCGQPYSSGLNSNNNKLTYYYRCENPMCEKFNKSERAKVAVEGAYAVLKDIKIMAEKALYDHYQAEMKRVISERNKELEMRRKALQATKMKEEKRLDSLKQYLLDAQQRKEATLVATFECDIPKAIENIARITKNLSDVEREKNENRDLTVSYEKFLEQFKNLASRLEGKPKLVEIDFTLRKIFSNIVLKDKKMLSYELNSPFRDFAEKGFLSFGRGDRIRTCDLTVPNRAL